MLMPPSRYATARHERETRAATAAPTATAARFIIALTMDGNETEKKYEQTVNKL